MPHVVLEGVHKSFGATRAVDGVDLQIHRGEFFTLLGPSGCGKTTLMRLIAGFDTPDRGNLTLGGASLLGLPPHRRPVNMMFQSYALFPHMTVAANIGFGLRYLPLTASERRERVAAMLALVRLDGLGDRPIDALSGGQRQRVALARALAREPDVLLLDEPLGALDRNLRIETQFELKRIQKRLGTTFIVVTHDQEEAMTLSDRIAVMDRGRIVQVAQPVALYEEPQNRFVAGFVGDINMLDAEVVSDDRTWLTLACQEAPDVLRDDQAEGFVPGQRVTIAVRPEKFTLHRADPGPGHNRLPGEVIDTAYLGDWTVVRARLRSGREVRASVANVSRLHVEAFQPGETVWLAFTEDAAIILKD